MTRKVFFTLVRIAALTIAAAGYIVGPCYEYFYLVATEGEGAAKFAIKHFVLFGYFPMFILSVPGFLALAHPFPTRHRSILGLIPLGASITPNLALPLYVLTRGFTTPPPIDGSGLGIVIAITPITVVLLLAVIVRSVSKASWE